MENALAQVLLQSAHLAFAEALLDLVLYSETPE
jgi:hypothetical protein